MRLSARSCVRCGKAFTPQRSNAKFCGSACYHAATVVGGYERKCAHCGDQFRRPVKGARFCGRACYLASKPLETVTKHCPRCDNDFTVPTNVADRFTVCSRTCRLAFTKYRDCARCNRRFASKVRSRYCSEECRRPRRIIHCRTCNIEFRAIPGDADRQFCCFSCYRKSRAETLLERSARLALDTIGVRYVQEMRMGRYSVDFALSDYGVALEVDGGYWHRNKARDARKEGFLSGHGWRVVRVAEADVKRMGAEQAIREALQDVIAFPQ